MLGIILVATAQLVLVWTMGVCVLAFMSPARARGLLPAAPVIGAAYLVVAFGLVGFVLPARVATWIIVPATVLAAAIAMIRRRRAAGSGKGMLPGRREWIASAAVLAIGAVAGAVAVLPSINARTALVIQPTASNDAFFYVEVTRWLLDNPLYHVPEIGLSPATGVDAPAFGPAYESLTSGLRVGQGYVRAAVSALTGLDPTAGFSPVLGVWVLLIPAGVWLVGRAFGMTGRAQLLLAAVLAFSYSLVNQVLNQNGDSLLGMSLFLATIGLMTTAMKPSAPDSPPRWLAAVMLTGLAGTYTEFAPFAGAAVLCILLFRRRPEYPAALRGLGIVIGIALLIGPVIWFRAIKSLLFVGGLATTGGAGDSGLPHILVEFLGPYSSIWRGSDPANHGAASIAAVVFFAVALTVGVLLAGASRRTRGLALGALLGLVIAAVIIVRSDTYIGGRSVAMVTPVVLTAAVMGWYALPSWFNRSEGRVGPALARALASAVCVGLVLVGVIASVRTITSIQPSVRVVTADYAEIAQCVIGDAGAEGDEVSVATSTIFDQLWVADALAENPDVAYPNIRGDLGYRGNGALISFWDGELDPLFLVGPGAFVAGADASLVCSSGKFEVIDMSGGAVVAIPMMIEPVHLAPGWGWVTDSDGGVESDGPGDVRILTSRSSLTDLMISIAGVEPGSAVQVSQEDRVISSAIADSSGRLVLPLDAVTVEDGGAQITLSVNSGESSFVLRGIHER